MSIVIKTKRAKPKTWSTSIMWLVFGLATIFFLVIYGQQLLLENDLKQRIAIQRSQNRAIEDTNTRLKASLQYYLSDKYLEQRAREDLNLRRADEEVLIPIKQEAEAPIAPDHSGQIGEPPGPGDDGTAPAQSTQTPPWQAWLSLFSPSGSSP